MDTKNTTTKEPLVSIVDDDVSVRRSTRRLLRCCGLRAEVFSSAEDFLQSGLAAETTCLLLDVRMPKMDGLELQRRLGETCQLIPIIFLSARASEEEERRTLRADAANFWRNPVSKEAVLHPISAGSEVTFNYQ